MLLVVGPGLLIVEDSTLGDASMVWVELFRLGANGGQRDRLLVLEQRINTLCDQLNGTLSQRFIDRDCQPGMSCLRLSGARGFWVGVG